MQCFKPIKIYLSDEERARRLADESLPIPLRAATYIYVPCGKCEACLSNRRSAWSFRLHQEVKVAESCYFITLTYDDEHLNYEYINNDGILDIVPVVTKRDCQLFLKRLRKAIEPFKIRFFLVSEYGPQNLRPHYHMLLFNFPNLLKNKLDEYLRNAWQLGFIRVDPVNAARIHYVTSYCLDSSTLPTYLPKNFMLCSRRPGLGSSYLDNDSVTQYHRNNLDDFGYIPSTHEPYKVKLPRYYSDKLFTDAERHSICDKHSEFHLKERIRLANRQKRWLRNRGIEPTELNLRLPIDGSPIAAELDKRNDFINKVQKQCKNKKNG